MIYDCDALRDLVPYVQFKTSERHPWNLNCTNDTKSRNASHMINLHNFAIKTVVYIIVKFDWLKPNKK